MQAITTNRLTIQPPMLTRRNGMKTVTVLIRGPSMTGLVEVASNAYPPTADVSDDLGEFISAPDVRADIIAQSLKLVAA